MKLSGVRRTAPLARAIAAARIERGIRQGHSLLDGLPRRACGGT
jgi:hypothetical protein